MLEKLIQAAIITFLLHLIAGLSPDSIQTKTAAPVPEKPPSMVSLLLRPFQ